MKLILIIYLTQYITVLSFYHATDMKIVNGIFYILIFILSLWNPMSVSRLRHISISPIHMSCAQYLHVPCRYHVGSMAIDNWKIISVRSLILFWRCKASSSKGGRNANPLTCILLNDILYPTSHSLWNLALYWSPN